MGGARVFHWDGKDIPEELRELPAGTYVVEGVDAGPCFMNDEEQGIAQALASLRAGQGHTAEQVRRRIDSLLRK
jgi:hypothetical protein